jgi:hypothetical protein
MDPKDIICYLSVAVALIILCTIILLSATANPHYASLLLLSIYQSIYDSIYNEDLPLYRYDCGVSLVVVIVIVAVNIRQWPNNNNNNNNVL